MDKITQIKEIVEKIQKNPDIQAMVIELMQSEDPEMTAKADQWLADQGYQCSFDDLCEYISSEVPLTDEQLDEVAGGASSSARTCLTGRVKFSK